MLSPCTGLVMVTADTEKNIQHIAGRVETGRLRPGAQNGEGPRVADFLIGLLVFDFWKFTHAKYHKDKIFN